VKRGWRVGLWAASAGAVVATARVASATPSAKLTYLRGPGAERCPDEGELKKAVAARLGYDVFFPWAKTTVVAEITRENKGFSGRVKVVDEHANVKGQRAIASTSEDCADVVRALALAISIAVDDFGLDDVPAPPPSTGGTGETPPSSERGDARPDVERAPAPTAPSPNERPNLADRGGHTAPAKPPAFGVALWIAPVVSFGVAPTAAAGAHADVEVRYRFASLGLEARGDLPASASAMTGGRVSTFVALGSIVPCVHLPAPLFWCGVASVGAFHESGSGLASSRSASATISLLGPRAGVELPIGGRFFFLAHADALATLTRHVVQIDGQDVFVIAPVTGSLGLGAGAHF
jgi:hypothetical protein